MPRGIASASREVVGARDARCSANPGRLSRAAAEGCSASWRYKDEYEVARLHAATDLRGRPVFHVAPPLITRIDPATGRRRKVAIPGWVARPLFRVLRHGKRLRGTPLDLFGRQAERQWERALIEQYRSDMRAALRVLSSSNLDAAVGIAEIPDLIRGYGPVKEANREKAMARRQVLLAALTGTDETKGVSRVEETASA